MTTFKAHFDGRTLVPEERVDLPLNQTLTIHVDDRVPPEKSITGAQLAKSGFAGLWKNRTDIGDSVMYAHKLRRLAETRGRSES